MADQYRVIQCPVAELEARLNELADDFVGFIWVLSADIPASSATVVLTRPPRQQIGISPGQLAIPIRRQ